jgi:hypothetical protein
MSLLDKVIAAVTPPESDEARAEARSKARAAAGSGTWFSMILEQHVQVENAFAAVKAANDRASRAAAQKWLATLLTGHSNAEETAIYPALTEVSEKSHATAGYTEQAATKMQLGLLETMDPMSQDYLDKLEHIQGAVQHHVYAEESNWFLDLKSKLPAGEESRLTRRFKEEFERYMGSDQPPRSMSAPNETTTRAASVAGATGSAAMSTAPMEAGSIPRSEDLDRDVTADGDVSASSFSEGGTSSPASSPLNERGRPAGGERTV